MADPCQIIWTSTLDGQFACEVRRDTETTGLLTMRDGENVILSKPVLLAFGAAFGPDVDDVLDWQCACMEALEARDAPESQANTLTSYREGEERE